jgi:putative ABC transport system permease protein
MTEFEEAFVAQFTKMFGDLPGLIRNVGLIVVASILFVVGNTMSGAVRERIRELAVLKAVGYGTARLIVLLAGEAVMMGLIGTVGCVAALLAFGISDAAGLSMPFFPIIAVSPAVVAIGIAVSVAVSLLAVVMPAHRVARLSSATTLREVA